MNCVLIITHNNVGGPATQLLRLSSNLSFGDHSCFKTVDLAQWDRNKRGLLTEAMVQKVEAREGRDRSTSSGGLG